jgi:hypothetical protein
MKNEFKGRTFPEGNLNGIVVPATTGDEVLQSYDFIDTTKWEDLAILFAMVVVYRLIAAAVMAR